MTSYVGLRGGKFLWPKDLQGSTGVLETVGIKLCAIYAQTFSLAKLRWLGAASMHTWGAECFIRCVSKFYHFPKTLAERNIIYVPCKADWARAKILISWRTIKSNQTQIGHNCATHRHLFTQTTHSHRFIWRDSYKFMYKVSYHIMMWLLMWWNGNLTFRCQINADFSAITEQPPNPASCFQQ